MNVKKKHLVESYPPQQIQ